MESGLNNRCDGRVMALDVGDRRIGVAVSDPSCTLASPLTVVYRRSRRKDVEAIVRLASDEGAVRLVVGLPLDSRGGRGEQALKAIAYARRLAAALPIPVVLWDERLSTGDAEDLLLDAGRSSRYRRERIDAAAAAVILQDYLDALRKGDAEAEVVSVPGEDSTQRRGGAEEERGV